MKTLPIHTLTISDAISLARSSPRGLTEAEAAARLEGGKSRQPGTRRTSALALLLRQFRSPLVLLMLAAMLLSFMLADHADAIIMLGVLLLSTVLSFWQEYHAADAVAALLSLIQTKANVLRDGRDVEIPATAIVPGDVVLLNAGDAIAGDGLLLESKDLFVDESALTGESFPVEKFVRAIPATARQSERTNAVFEGTHVVSGTATALMLRTGSDTEFGGIGQRLRARTAESDFERGLRRFGEMLIRVTLLLLLAVFAIHVSLERPLLEAFMFALALAVGMTPELLPAIVSLTLARGAQRMAAAQVIVRRLVAIENFGSMDVLCSDKTGTLTEGRMSLHAAVDTDGRDSPQVRLLAVLNATFETGFANPIDDALRALAEPALAGYAKVDEVPYDFIRKRLSVVVRESAPAGRQTLITKGAFANVLDVCTLAFTTRGAVPIQACAEDLRRRFEAFSAEGYRVLGIGFRDITGDPMITREDETDLTFAGFLLFQDPPKAGAIEAIAALRRLGIAFKVITGDNRFAARHLASQMGQHEPRILTGDSLRVTADAALVRQANDTDIFAEIEPTQKERIILALRKAGHVVGYLGDGINDAPALHASDIGVSVDHAVDIAREAADIVLLRHDLAVVAEGVREGRQTFANTLKYLFVTNSANFGNMISMAAASLFLPFLPLLPKQILLNNFLSDLPALTIAADAVDAEQLTRPRRWDLRLIRRFMISFGLLSSLFDMLVFWLLFGLMRVTEATFQTGWFLESVLTELVIIFVIRTRRPFHRSRPARLLLGASAAVLLTTLLLPYLSLAPLLGLTPLPWPLLIALCGITALYFAANEFLKSWVFAAIDHGLTSAPGPASTIRR